MPPDDSTLPGFDGALTPAAPSLLPVSGRDQPAVWVAKLGVFKSWPPSTATRLREIELRRGLNIIWARPEGANVAARRLGGHGAGKTTFCRLLRYALGDGSAGTHDFRSDFEGKLGIGWVLAEVHLGGRRWLVGRPITASGSGYHSFAIDNGALTDAFPERPPRSGYHEFQVALDKAVFGSMSIRTLPDSKKAVDWPRLLQWLTRDQESHFSGLLDWRHRDSDHESPEISADDRANLIRLVLGLVQDKEQELLTKHAGKSSEHESKVRDRPKLEFAVERERKALADALEMPVGDPKDAVLQLEVSNRVTNLRNASNLAVRAAQQQGETDLLLNEIATRQAEWQLAKAWIEEIEEAVDVEEKRLQGIAPSPPKVKTMDDLARQMISSLNPFRGVCSHPIDKAWRAKCPIAHERPADDEVQTATKEIAAGAQAMRTELEKLKAELARRRAIGAPKKAAVDSANALLNAARKRQAQELERLQEPARQAASLEALLKAYQKACADLETLGSEIKSLDQEKRDLDAQLSALTKQHRKLIDQFTALFHHVARHMLGSAVIGSVGFSGKSIEPRIEYHGPRDSAALKVTKWLAFDLAALALGIAANKASHPRFMLHDSPRESDLAPEIYGGLFAAAREFEGTFGESAPFQYIVTTTQPPPDSVSGAPWMRLELDASVEGGRFLGVDL
jgi:hypothetical protein